MTRILPILAVAALLASACSSTSDESADGGDDQGGSPTAEQASCEPARGDSPDAGVQKFDHDGVEREYQITFPGDYDGSSEAPVIVNLHGLTSNMQEQALLSDLTVRGTDRGYVVVTPQGLSIDIPIGGGFEATWWNVVAAVDTSGIDQTLVGADDLGFINELLDALETDFCLDADREYATGMSNGAGLTTALGCEPNSRFAALAPVAGTNIVSNCQSDAIPSTIAFHGDDDQVVPYEGGDIYGFPLDLPSYLDRVGEMAAKDGCEADPTTEELFDDVTLTTWEGCPDGIMFEAYTVIGGGHTWPGVTTYAPEGAFDDAANDRDAGFEINVEEMGGHQTTNIVATDLILDFFDENSAA